MSRLPKAKSKVLEAARQIVVDRGAGALTFDELAEVSGVTRGGITYHYATKQALLQALIEHDISHWKEIEAGHRPDDVADELAELIAYLRAHTSPDAERRRFVTGMVGAATHDPSVLSPVREQEAERLADIEWDDRTLRQQILRMAAFGMFWADFFQCPELPGSLKAKLVDLMEQLAVEWTDTETSPTDVDKKPRQTSPGNTV